GWGDRRGGGLPCRPAPFSESSSPEQTPHRETGGGAKGAAVKKKTAWLEIRTPPAPIPAAARAAPMEANRALRPSLSAMAAWPTSPRLIAAIAGPSTQLAAEGRPLPAITPPKNGQKPITPHPPPIPSTAKAERTRSERAASTRAPPGIWPTRATRLPAVNTSPISPCVHFCAVK